MTTGISSPNAIATSRMFFRTGCRRLHTAAWRGDDAGVVSRECLRQLVFLAFLKQEQIQCFLYFLLTFHRKQVFCLGGIGRDTGCRLLFASL